MALGKAMHILAFVYYCGCVAVDLSFDFHADPTHGRTYYCVFRQGSLEAVMENWTWKHYYVIFAFVVLGPAQMIALIAKLCRRKGGPYDALTLLLCVLGAVVPIVLSNITHITPMCALYATDVAGHAKHADALGYIHLSVLFTYLLVIGMRATEKKPVPKPGITFNDDSIEVNVFCAETMFQAPEFAVYQTFSTDDDTELEGYEKDKTD